MNTEVSKKSVSLLTIDVGSVNTRAHLFDAVEGRYRFLAGSEAFSTIGSPAFDLNLGVLDALQQLESITGKTLLSERGLLVTTDPDDPVGANAVVTTFSGGQSIKVVTVGLLESVSLSTIRKLISSGYCEIIETFSLNDRRQSEVIIDAICQKLPDLVAIGGGTNRGASRSVIRLANILALAVSLIPKKQRPDILYAGNENLREEIDNLFGDLARVHFADNVRPSLQTESLGPARKDLNRIFFEIQTRKLGGLQQLSEISGDLLYPNAHAFGRLVRFMSTVIDPPKGALGVDLGASNTSVAAAIAGKLDLRVYTRLGMGKGLKGMIEETLLTHVMRWLAVDLPEDRVLDYLYNKPLIPQSLPTSAEDLAIEQAAARQVLRTAMRRSVTMFDAEAIYPLPGNIPWFDRIIISGSTTTRAPRQEDSLLMILDGIQPVGIATVILDSNNLGAAIGASADIDPLLSIQVLETNAFINLGTVISPTGSAREGNPVLRIQIQKEWQTAEVVEVKAGDLQTIPIANGEVVDVFVQPLQNTNIGLGNGRGGWIRRVVGGLFGLIVDGRGRPIQLPTSIERRQKKILAWNNALTKT
ncbi:MAG: glutamate mutase L [Anaerolineales bacterium]